MTDMMKTVLQSGTGTNAAISGVYQAGKTGTSNYADDELAKLTKPYYYSSIVTPDELFVGYTPKYSMAVWTGYSNRLTPILDDGVKVATDVYREMMLYLAQDGSASEDWEMPDGLYRSGSYVYLNSGTGYNRYYNNQQYYNYSSYSSYSTEASSDTSASSEHSGDSNNNSSNHSDSSSGNGGDD